MTNFSPKDKLESLYRQMYLLLQEEESLRSETEALLKKTQKSVDPRREFNTWLRSAKGQEWKRKQFEYQQNKCAFCKQSLRYEDAVVHHVVPLSKIGSVANKPENFKLLHPSCNSKIGTKIVNFN